MSSMDFKSVTEAKKIYSDIWASIHRGNSLRQMLFHARYTQVRLCFPFFAPLLFFSSRHVKIKLRPRRAALGSFRLILYLLILLLDPWLPWFYSHLISGYRGFPVSKNPLRGSLWWITPNIAFARTCCSHDAKNSCVVTDTIMASRTFLLDQSWLRARNFHPTMVFEDFQIKILCGCACYGECQCC